MWQEARQFFNEPKGIDRIFDIFDSIHGKSLVNLCRYETFATHNTGTIVFSHSIVGAEHRQYRRYQAAGGVGAHAGSEGCVPQGGGCGYFLRH